MGTAPDGRRDVVSQRFQTRALASAWLQEQAVARSRQDRVAVSRDGQTLAQWLEEFYTQHRVGRKGRLLSDATIAKDRESVRTYLLKANPTLAGTPLLKVTTDALAQHFVALARRGLSRNTIARLHRILRARLTFAVRKGKLRANPLTTLEAMDTLVVDGVEPRRRVVLSPEQAAAVLAVAPAHRHGAFFATMLLTGMRPGEVAALTWDDVDLEGRRLHVRRSLERVRGADGAAIREAGGGAAANAWRLKAPKTEKTRSLPIGQQLVTMLRGHREADASHLDGFRDQQTAALAPEYQDHGFVFHTEFGGPLHLETLSRRYLRPVLVAAACRLTKRTLPALPERASKAYRAAREARDAAEAAALAAAKMPPVTLYELRHTSATLLLQENVHPKIVQDRLGHARASTTLDIYSHVTPDLQDVAVDALTRALKRPRSKNTRK
ncbi:MAG: site-specific integrase [Gemmatimonadaceae bacterium]|jgi:integrase|nr:site-specific integrase [Gemmatimonadaceae bacterium]